MSLSHSHQSRNYYGGIGAVAGDVVTLGILVTDRLRSVINMTTGVDMTAEFTITADDTINNVGGTSTAAQFLLVVVDTPDPRGFTGAERF